MIPKVVKMWFKKKKKSLVPKIGEEWLLLTNQDPDAYGGIQTARRARVAYCTAGVIGIQYWENENMFGRNGQQYNADATYYLAEDLNFIEPFINPMQQPDDRPDRPEFVPREQVLEDVEAERQANGDI